MTRKKNRNYKVPLKVIVPCVIILAIGTVAAFALKMFFTRYHYFNISKVSIQGAQDSPYADFRRRLIGKNIFSLDLRGLKKQIEAEQENVRCAFVQRRLPGELLFFLEKRIPVAQVKLLRYHLVDNLAQIMPYASDLAFADFPVILGLQDKMQGKNSYAACPELERAVELLKEMNSIPALGAYRITRINISSDRANSFYLLETSSGGEPLNNVSPAAPVEVKFSLDKSIETARVLALLLKKRSLQTVEYIDLKNIDSPVILEKKEKSSR